MEQIEACSIVILVFTCRENRGKTKGDRDPNHMYSTITLSAPKRCHGVQSKRETKIAKRRRMAFHCNPSREEKTLSALDGGTDEG